MEDELVVEELVISLELETSRELVVRDDEGSVLLLLGTVELDDSKLVSDALTNDVDDDIVLDEVAELTVKRMAEEERDDVVVSLLLLLVDDDVEDRVLELVIVDEEALDDVGSVEDSMVEDENVAKRDGSLDVLLLLLELLGVVDAVDESEVIDGEFKLKLVVGEDTINDEDCWVTLLLELATLELLSDDVKLILLGTKLDVEVD